MTKSIKTASVLSFERKLSNSDALMFSGNWKDREDEKKWSPIVIQEKSVRGTISNRFKNPKARDDAKLDADPQSANLQTVDVAALPFDTDALKVVFTLRILGNLAIPFVCNDQDYQAMLVNKINTYITEQGFMTLSLRYAENLANGRFLWRNRVGAESLEVRVSSVENGKNVKSWVFNCSDFSLNAFSNATNDLTQLAEIIKLGLKGNSFVLLKVEAFARLGAGQEVFPSQELILDKKNDSKKSKTLYQVVDQAAIHSQKIGNALRTIDTWHPAADEVGPISVESYGSVTNKGEVYRASKTNEDFYTLLDSWVLKDKNINVDQQHYVIATLIRGGVFGEKEKADK